MAREFSKKLYASKAWKDCRESYIASVGGLCESCLEDGKYTPGKIVHHKIHVSPENVNDVTVTLNHDNLAYWCQDCHNRHHMGEGSYIREGLGFNENGELVKISEQ